MPKTATDVVISAIPTEPLAAYTALVGVVIGAVGLDDSRSYLPSAGGFGAFLAVVVAAVWLAYAREQGRPPTAGTRGRSPRWRSSPR